MLLKPIHPIYLSAHFRRSLWLALLLAVCAGESERRAYGQNATANQNRAGQVAARRTLTGQSDAKNSRYTINASGAVNDYEAFRSNDGRTFYLKIPNADPGRLPHWMRAVGVENMQVQRNGNDAVITFRLQPGVTARVNQRQNQLDVVFATPGSAPQGNIYRGDTENGRNSSAAANNNPRVIAPDYGANNRRVTVIPSRTPLAATNESPRAVAGQPTGNIASAPNDNPTVAGKNNPGSPTPEGVTPNETPTDVTATAVGVDNSKSAAPGMSASGDGQPASSATVNPASNNPAGDIAGSASRRSLWWLLLPLGLLLGLAAWFLTRRRPQRAARQTAAADTDTAPRSPVAAHNETPIFASATSGVSVPAQSRDSSLKPANKIAVVNSPALLAAAVVEGRPSPTQNVERNADVPSDATRRETLPASGKDFSVSPETLASAFLLFTRTPVGGNSSGAKSVTPEDRPAALATDGENPQRNVIGATARLLEGAAYDLTLINAPDTATRGYVSAELLAALAGNDEARRARARQAFVEHGFLAEAVRDLQTTKDANRRRTAARALALARTPSATPHLIAALQDANADVRRHAVWGLAELHAPAAYLPLEKLLARERDLPAALIRHALAACAPAADNLDRTTTLKPKAPPPEVRQSI